MSRAQLFARANFPAHIFRAHKFSRARVFARTSFRAHKISRAYKKVGGSLAIPSARAAVLGAGTPTAEVTHLSGPLGCFRRFRRRFPEGAPRPGPRVAWYRAGAPGAREGPRLARPPLESSSGRLRPIVCHAVQDQFAPPGPPAHPNVCDGPAARGALWRALSLRARSGARTKVPSAPQNSSAPFARPRGAVRIKVGKTEKVNGRPFGFSVFPTLILRAPQGRPNGALGFCGALGILVHTPDRARN